MRSAIPNGPRIFTIAKIRRALAASGGDTHSAAANGSTFVRDTATHRILGSYRMGETPPAETESRGEQGRSP